MPIITVTAEVPVDPENATVTYYQDLSNQLNIGFDQITAIIPKLLEAEALSARSVRANLGVSEGFCNTAITAVEQFAEVEAAKKLSAERARNLLQFVQAFGPVADKVEGFLKRLKHALRAAKSEVATDSLDVYRVVRSLAGDGRSPALATLAAAMKRDLGRKSPTKAEREELKKQKFQQEVEKAVALRMEEVKKAA